MSVSLFDCIVNNALVQVFLTLNTCKKNSQFKTVCNGDTAYITQLKEQKSKRCYYFCSTSP